MSSQHKDEASRMLEILSDPERMQGYARVAAAEMRAHRRTRMQVSFSSFTKWMIGASAVACAALISLSLVREEALLEGDFEGDNLAVDENSPVFLRAPAGVSEVRDLASIEVFEVADLPGSIEFFERLGYAVDSGSIARVNIDLGEEVITLITADPPSTSKIPWITLTSGFETLISRAQKLGWVHGVQGGDSKAAPRLLKIESPGGIVFFFSEI